MTNCNSKSDGGLGEASGLWVHAPNDGGVAPNTKSSVDSDVVLAVRSSVSYLSLGNLEA